MKTFNTANKKYMKKINTKAILNVIRNKGPISRADIAKILSLNPATVSNNANDLIESNLIESIGSGDSSGGRRPILLCINKRNYIIGVETELTHLNVGIINLEGEIICKEKHFFRFMNNEPKDRYIVLLIIKAIKDIKKKMNIDEKNYIGIGLGIHGLVDTKKGVSIFAPSFDWHYLNIKQILKDEFETKIIVDNDVHVMALAEKWVGKAKDNHNFILMHIGEGIGGALVINDQIYSGNTFGAGEIGHVKVTSRPVMCNCGNKGCLTTVASEEAIVKRMKQIISNENNNKYNINDVSMDYIYKLALENDEIAVKLLKETGEYIGKGLGLLVNIINPEKVILTGSVLIAKEFLMKYIKNSAALTSIPDNYQKTEITTSDIKKDIGIIGAATLIINDIFEK